MKKVLFLISFVVLALTACGGGGNGASDNAAEIKGQQALETAAIEANALCPMTLDIAMTLTGVDYDKADNEFVYTYSYNEAIAPVSQLRENGDVLAENLINTLKDSPETLQIIEMVKEAGAKIVYKFIGNDSGDKFLIIYNPATGKYETK